MPALIVKAVIILVGLLAILLTLKADFVVEKILHKEATLEAVLRVKYTALAIAAAVCIMTFIFG